MQSLIDWFNESIWHLLSIVAQLWTAPLSVLGHSWPTFFLCPAFQYSLFTLLWAEFFLSSIVQNAKGEDVNNFLVALAWRVERLNIKTKNRKTLQSSTVTGINLVWHEQSLGDWRGNAISWASATVLVWPNCKPPTSRQSTARPEF